jgi:hypothetical protein
LGFAPRFQSEDELRGSRIGAYHALRLDEEGIGLSGWLGADRAFRPRGPRDHEERLREILVHFAGANDQARGDYPDRWGQLPTYQQALDVIRSSGINNADFADERAIRRG